MAMSKSEEIADIKGKIEELQMWFARKPYGWTERATPEQLQQWTDREREQESLNARLETLEG
jgi:hypothetical protein